MKPRPSGRNALYMTVVRQFVNSIKERNGGYACTVQDDPICRVPPERPSIACAIAGRHTGVVRNA